jgi:hypothetical protein
MDPRQWNHRSINIWMNKVNNSLDEMTNTMYRVESIVQQAEKMKSSWQQLRDSVRKEPEAPQSKVKTKAYHSKAQPKSRKNGGKRS